MKNGLKRFWGRCMAGVLTASMMVTSLPMSAAAATGSEPSKIDLGGMEITVLNDWTDWEFEPGDSLKAVMEEYNFTITVKKAYEYYNGSSYLLDHYDSDENLIYTFTNPQVTAEMMRRGYLYDLSTLDCLDFSTGNYYDNKVAEAYTYQGGIYAMSAVVPEGLVGLYYNKDIVEQVTKDSLYDLQDAGEWTIDEWIAIMSGIQGLAEQPDLIPLAAYQSEIYAYLQAAYNTGLLGMDENGMLVNTCDSDEMMKVLDKAGQILTYNQLEDEKSPVEQLLEGNTAFALGYMHDGYNGSAYSDEINVGFVMFPAATSGEAYRTYDSNPLTVLPASYSAEKAWKLAFAYNLLEQEYFEYNRYSESDWKLDSDSYTSTVCNIYDTVIPNYSYVYANREIDYVIQAMWEGKSLREATEEISASVDKQIALFNGNGEGVNSCLVDCYEDRSEYGNYQSINIDAGTCASEEEVNALVRDVISEHLITEDFNVAIYINNLPEELKELDLYYETMELLSSLMEDNLESGHYCLVSVGDEGYTYYEAFEGNLNTGLVVIGGDEDVNAGEALGQYIQTYCPQAKGISYYEEIPNAHIFINLKLEGELQNAYVYKQTEDGLEYYMTVECNWIDEYADTVQSCFGFGLQETGFYVITDVEVPGITIKRYHIYIDDYEENPNYSSQWIDVEVDDLDSSDTLDERLRQVQEDSKFCTDGRNTTINFVNAEDRSMIIGSDRIARLLEASGISKNNGEEWGDNNHSLMFKFDDTTQVGFWRLGDVHDIGWDTVVLCQDEDGEIRSLLGEAAGELLYYPIRVNAEKPEGSGAFYQYTLRGQKQSPDTFNLYRYEDSYFVKVNTTFWGGMYDEGYEVSTNMDEAGLYLYVGGKLPASLIKGYSVYRPEEYDYQDVNILRDDFTSCEELVNYICWVAQQQDVEKNINTTFYLRNVLPEELEFTISAQKQQEIWNTLELTDDDTFLRFSIEGYSIILYRYDSATDWLGFSNHVEEISEAVTKEIETALLENLNEIPDMKLLHVEGLQETNSGFSIEIYDKVQGYHPDGYLYRYENGEFELFSWTSGNGGNEEVTTICFSVFENGDIVYLYEKLPDSMGKKYDIWHYNEEDWSSQDISIYAFRLEQGNIEDTVRATLKDERFDASEKFTYYNFEDDMGHSTFYPISKELAQEVMQALGFDRLAEDENKSVSFDSGRARISFNNIDGAKDFDENDIVVGIFEQSESYQTLQKFYGNDVPDAILVNAVGEPGVDYMGYWYSIQAETDIEAGKEITIYYYNQQAGLFETCGTRWVDSYYVDENQQANYIYVDAYRGGEYIAVEQPLDEKLLFTPTYINFVQQPEDVQIHEGETASFSVAVDNPQDVESYQWQWLVDESNWAPVPEIGESDYLSFVPTKEDNLKWYRCAVTDRNGEMYFSDAAQLEVFVTLEIIGSPVDATVTDGKTANFYIEANGDGLTYQWQYKNANATKWSNSGVSSAKNTNFKFLANSTLNGRQYRCVVTDLYGATRISNEVTLHVVAAPKITKQPVDVTAKAGDTVNFTVAATGDGLTYQWQYKNANATKWSNSSSSVAKTTTMSFKVNSDSFLNGRQYRCVVTDQYGQSVISAEATLTVKTGPVITSQPVNALIESGKTVTFSVTATGTGLTYQWQYQNPYSSTWSNSRISAAKTANMTFTADSSAHGRKYRCIVKDSTGASVVSESATLSIKAKPAIEITSQPKNISAVVGDSVTFSVAATGNSLKYQWQYKSSTASTWSNSGITAAKTAKMTFPANSTALNGRQYRCVITDTNGNQLISDVATLTVEVAGPEITSQPRNVTAKIADTVSFQVVARGTGLTYQWQYKNANATTWSASSAKAAKTATMTFKVGTDKNLDGRQYRCVITDANGKQVISDAATLTLANAPVITAQPVSKVVKNNETVSFTVAATGEGLTYQWQFQLPGASTWTNSGISSAKTATITFQANTSISGRKYRCIVKNATGAQTSSEAATLTVSNGPQIIDQSTSGNATVGEEESLYIYAEGDDLSYCWQVKQDGKWVDIVGGSCEYHAFTPDSSMANKTFVYRCVVTDAHGVSVSSAEIYLSVVSNVPEITAQPVSQTVSVGQTVTFTVVSPDAEWYQWQYRASESDSWHNSTISSAYTEAINFKVSNTSLNGRQYRCVLSKDGVEEISSDVVTLTVTQ